MLNSMTGFGRGISVRDGLEITVEMRSVNHRYTDFLLRLPRELGQLEEKIRFFLREKIERGRLEVTVTLGKPIPGTRRVEIDFQLAEELGRMLIELSRSLPLDLKVGSLFAGLLPEIVNIQTMAADEQLIWDILQEPLEQALDELVCQRKREGNLLLQDLEQRCSHLDDLLEEISTRAPLVYEEHRLRLEKKLQGTLGSPQIDENRLLMECALMVDKAGIDEELVRLRSHLQAFGHALAEPGAVGRKLDFIAQEMFRESNTIGAKSIDYRLTSLVVEMKTELEKIREQIQNIE